MSSDPFEKLGEFLTASEAEALAVQFEAGKHTTQALGSVNAPRRAQAKELLLSAGVSHLDAPATGRILRAIAGAKTVLRELTPVWTMPGDEAKSGHLTSEFHRLVRDARQSVVCATYNFMDTSKMVDALRSASEQPGIVVTVYVDGEVADGGKVKGWLPKAVVYRSAALPGGKHIKSHAKFVVIDHAILLITSANFSYSAENLNIEFGLFIHDPTLAWSEE